MASTISGSRSPFRSNIRKNSLRERADPSMVATTTVLKSVIGGSLSKLFEGEGSRPTLLQRGSLWTTSSRTLAVPPDRGQDRRGLIRRLKSGRRSTPFTHQAGHGSLSIMLQWSPILPAATPHRLLFPQSGGHAAYGMSSDLSFPFSSFSRGAFCTELPRARALATIHPGKKGNKVCPFQPSAGLWPLRSITRPIRCQATTSAALAGSAHWSGFVDRLSGVTRVLPLRQQDPRSASAGRDFRFRATALELRALGDMERRRRRTREVRFKAAPWLATRVGSIRRSH